MGIDKINALGNINVSVEAIASLAGAAATECYGVVGMASQKVVRDGFATILRKENYSKGIVVRETNEGLELDLYIVIAYGMKISEIVYEVQKRVKYMLEKTLDIEFKSVNIYVQAVKMIG